MWKFCNDDKHLIRKGGRKAPLITRKEFLRNIKKYCAEDRKIYEDALGIDPSDINPENKDVLYRFAERIYYTRESDRSVMFDAENIDAGTGEFGYEICGIRILKNGLPILGVTAGGDWELPLFFCIYWDGKKFRLYVPRYGNTFNIVAKAAFGSDENGAGWSKYERDLIKAGIDPNSIFDSTEDFGCIYSTLYGKNNLAYEICNTNAIEEDICSRIEII